MSISRLDTSRAHDTQKTIRSEQTAAAEYRYADLKENVRKLRAGDKVLGDPQVTIIDQGWIRSDPNILYIARLGLDGKIADVQLNADQKAVLKKILK